MLHDSFSFVEPGRAPHRLTRPFEAHPGATTFPPTTHCWPRDRALLWAHPLPATPFQCPRSRKATRASSPELGPNLTGPPASRNTCSLSTITGAETETLVLPQACLYIAPSPYFERARPAGDPVDSGPGATFCGLHPRPWTCHQLTRPACGRGAGTHGDVLNLHTESVLSLHTGFSACHTTRHTPHHTTQHHTSTHDDTHTPPTHGDRDRERLRGRERRKKTEREKRRERREERRKEERRKRREERGEAKRREEKRREEKMKKKMKNKKIMMWD